MADTQAAAIGISHWLDRFGVENFLVDKTTLGLSHGISFTSDDPSSDGWQIWVKDISQIESARELLAEKAQDKEKQSQLGPIEARCEECGTSHEFAGQHRGTIQNCPNCGRFMDVGGEEDPFDWPDSFDAP